MGRYAFFNTGFEYKFWFGIQGSDHIRWFGGYVSVEDWDKHDFQHAWEVEDDTPVALGEIRKLEAEHGIPAIDFEPFEKTLDGTHALRTFLRDNIPDSLNENTQALYMLGCLIYHQITYTPNLTATYEM